MARRSRLSARKKKQRKDNTSSLVKISIVVAIFTAIAAAYYNVVSQTEILDPITLCPPTPRTQTVLLIDVTDPLTLPQQQDFLNQLEALRQFSEQYEKITIAKVDTTTTRLLEPVLEICNPGTAADTDIWTGNPQLLDQQHQEQFTAPLNTAFESLLQHTAADRSPIFESIQSLALTELQQRRNAQTPKKLIIVSDLLQNTSQASFYGSIPNSTSFVESDYFNRVRTDLRGVQIELWMLQRRDHSTTQKRDLIDFWKAALEAQGAELTRVYRISG